MNECELCGKPDSNIRAIIEGSIVNVCKNCARFGEVIEIKKQIEKSLQPKKIIKIEEEYEAIKPNYAELIKNARESLFLTQKEAAKLISEKESIYQKIESGSFKPSIATAKKFERFFQIKLVESYKESKKTKALDIENRDITIGDLLKLKK